MSRSKSQSALPSKLIDLTHMPAYLPRPQSGMLSPTSRQSNHSAFSPLGSGSFSPALLPLHKSRSKVKLGQYERRAPLTASRETLTQWALRYAPM